MARPFAFLYRVLAALLIVLAVVVAIPLAVAAGILLYLRTLLVLLGMLAASLWRRWLAPLIHRIKKFAASFWPGRSNDSRKLAAKQG